MAPVAVKVVSAGFKRGHASVHVNGASVLTRVGRGVNLVVLVAATGAVESMAAFDTHGDRGASERLRAAVESVPPGRLVVATVHDEASYRLDRGSGRAALKALGATQLDAIGWRHAWLMVARTPGGQCLAEHHSGGHPVECTVTVDVEQEEAAARAAEAAHEEAQQEAQRRAVAAAPARTGPLPAVAPLRLFEDRSEHFGGSPTTRPLHLLLFGGMGCSKSSLQNAFLTLLSSDGQARRILTVGDGQKTCTSRLRTVLLQDLATRSKSRIACTDCFGTGDESSPETAEWSTDVFAAVLEGRAPKKLSRLERLPVLSAEDDNNGEDDGSHIPRVDAVILAITAAEAATTSDARLALEPLEPYVAEARRRDVPLVAAVLKCDVVEPSFPTLAASAGAGAGAGAGAAAAGGAAGGDVVISDALRRRLDSTKTALGGSVPAYPIVTYSAEHLAERTSAHAAVDVAVLNLLRGAVARAEDCRRAREDDSLDN